MVITCWSAKGGAGVTTVAAALAWIAAAEVGGATLVDLTGDDAFTVLGRPAGSRAGVSDLLADDTDPASLATSLQLAADVDRTGLGVVGRGSSAWRGGGDILAEALARVQGTVVVDAGTIPRFPADDPAVELATSSTRSLLVLRSCFLSVRRAVVLPFRPSGVVLVREPSRALRPSDVEMALGVAVEVEVPWDPAVARAVDAGLFASRMPSVLRDALRWAA